jgi:hypothetical protein
MSKTKEKQTATLTTAMLNVVLKRLREQQPEERMIIYPE